VPRSIVRHDTAACTHPGASRKFTIDDDVLERRTGDKHVRQGQGRASQPCQEDGIRRHWRALLRRAMSLLGGTS
jgi:hypothetical protein